MTKIYHLKNTTQKPSVINYARDLNRKQLEIVQKADGACLVLAGAGSGKTRTLIYRVAYLLEKGIKPENILLMTFTNKAATEMTQRVKNLLGQNTKGLWAGTFHHIGNRLLRQYIKKLGYKNNYTIADQEDSKDLIKNIIGQLNYRQDKYFPKAGVVKNIISFSLNSGQTIKETLSKKFTYLKEELAEPIEEIFSSYQQKKKELNILDYDDLLLLWLKILKQETKIRKTLADKFKYILVDEYQDTNSLQAEIIELLTSSQENILVVGDDAQSIYSFRAANIDNILSFPKKFANVKTFKLEENYRSTPQILKLANNSIQNNQRQFSKKLFTNRNDGDKPVLVPVQNNEQQAEFICQRVIELHEEGMKLKDMAVMFRADYHALELELMLNKKGIPYLKRGGIKFFEQAHLKDITSFLKILHNPHDEIAWTRILTLANGIGRVGAQKIILQIKDKNILQISKLKLDLPGQLNRAWQEFKNIFFLISQLNNNQIAETIETIKNNFYFSYLENNYENADKRQDDIEQLINFADSYKSLEQFLSDTTLSENFQVEKSRDDNSDDYLILTTIHQAKGLEWPVVFIINLTSGQFPHAKAMNSVAEIEEERRLFYVATTRTQDKLYLLYPLINYTHSAGLIFSQPSEFIQELDNNLYEQWQIDTDDNEQIVEYLPAV